MNGVSVSSRRRQSVAGVAGLSVLVIAVAIFLHFGRSVGLPPAQNRRMMAPLTLHLLGGGTWSLAEHRGQVVAINYWASWCGPCWEETPELIRLDRELRPRGLTIVGIAMDERSSEEVPEAVNHFLETLHVPYGIALSPPMSQTAYAMEGLPTTILIDRDGRIARTYVGAIRERAFRADVEALLREPTE